MAEPKMTYSLTYNEKFDIEDYENRHLYLVSEIDGTTVMSISYHINRFNRLDKGIPIEERKPILLFINSPGGSVSDGYNLVDTITKSKTPVYTINWGFCASMAFIIFISGHKRYSLEHSEFLMHDGSTGLMFESTAKAKDRIDFEAGEIEDMTKEFIMSKTLIDEQTYDYKYRIEWYMLPDIAKKYGICDLIVGIDCDSDDIL